MQSTPTVSLKTATSISEDQWFISLGDLEVIRLRVHAQATQAIHMPPYWGSTLRGAFGMALLRSCCVLRRQKCETCPLRGSCVYSYVFDTPVNTGENNKRYSNAPHPFVFHLNLEQDQEIQPGGTFFFEMTVIGKAIKHLPYIVLAFHRMGRIGIGKGRGKFDIEDVKTVGPDGKELEVVCTQAEYCSPSATLSLNRAYQEAVKMNTRKLELSFLTPTRLTHQGKLCRELVFSVLVRNLAMRLLNLQRFHGKPDSDLPVSEMAAAAETIRTVRENITWHDWQRYSHRQKKRMTLGGMVGKVEFEGEMAPFLPLLILGSWINLGKGTSFGLGRYQIVGTKKEE